jgi:hypothetical protein
MPRRRRPAQDARFVRTFGPAIYARVAAVVRAAPEPIEWELAIRAALLVLCRETGGGAQNLRWLRDHAQEALDAARVGFIDTLLRRNTPADRDALLTAIAAAADAEELAEYDA